MGSAVHVVLEHEDGEVRARGFSAVRGLLADLETRWSRFLASSEVSRLNDGAPAPVRLSTDTLDVLQEAVDGWRLTGGRFDPTVGDAMVRNGYVRTFTETARAGVVDVDVTTGPTAGCGAITIDREAGTARLAAGARVDLGGIGKGRAADLAVERLAEIGIDTACVNVGGDVRVQGGAHVDGGWVVAVDDPFDEGRTMTSVALTEGAVATSARTRRRWPTADGWRHHLIDPRTGRPACSGLAQVTVLAADATTAEVLTKAAFVAGPDEAATLLEGWGVAGLLVTDDGARHRIGGIEGFER